MSLSRAPLLDKAAEAFRNGQYLEAKIYYAQASELFGVGFFDCIVNLCDKRLRRSIKSNESVREGSVSNSGSAGANSALTEQLNSTQSLLEKYYIRCQELEHQLLDGMGEKTTK